MSNRLLICLLVLVPAGCARKIPLPPPGGAQLPPAPRQAASAALAVPVRSYEGRTAAQWAAQLASADPQVRQRASQALGALNQDGTPYLLQALRSSSPETQLNALQAFYKPELVRHANETLPAMLRMLENKDDAIRLNAAARLPWFEKRATQAMPLLQYLAANDPSAEVRAAARESMVFINYAATGVPPKHGH